MTLGWILLTLLTVFVVAGERRVPINERLVVFRLGRFLRILGPGRTYAIPLVDKVARIALDERVPHWRSLTEEELLDEIRTLVRASGYVVPEPRGRPTRS